MNRVPIVARRLLVAVLLLATTVTACGSNKPRVYQPIAASDIPGVCYFLYYPEECFGRGIPMPMPAYWHARYYRYYSHPGLYINRYVPVEHRRTVVQQEKTYQKQNKTQIKQEEKVAAQENKTGTTVNGPVSTLGGGKRDNNTATTLGGGKRDSTATTKATSGGQSNTTLGGGKRETQSTSAPVTAAKPPVTAAKPPVTAAKPPVTAAKPAGNNLGGGKR